MHVEIPIIDLTDEDKQSEVTITEVVNEHGYSDVGKVDFFERVLVVLTVRRRLQTFCHLQCHLTWEILLYTKQEIGVLIYMQV